MIFYGQYTSNSFYNSGPLNLSSDFKIKLIEELKILLFWLEFFFKVFDKVLPNNLDISQQDENDFSPVENIIDLEEDFEINKQRVTIHILLNISWINDNQETKLGQLIEYYKTNIFLENHTWNEAGRLVTDHSLFFKKALYMVNSNGL